MLSFLERVMPLAWAARGPLAILLWPLSLVFLLLIRLRAACYALGILSSARAGVPVVVVGNIIAGGSGKTPVVIALCQQLAAAGWVPGVVSRGYGGKVQGVAAVRPDSDPAHMGDEPVLIAQRSGCPVFVGRQRVAAARALLAAHPEVNVLVSDDGLQHLALARDVEIVVMDERGAGNGWLLPAGPLREPVSRLRSVDALVWNGVKPSASGTTAFPLSRGGRGGLALVDKPIPDPAHPLSGEGVSVGAVPQFSMQLSGEEFYCLAEPHRRSGAKDFSSPLHAIAGIGHPARFFDHLRSLGLEVEAHPFPDHHPYTAEDFALARGGVILMTEKDAVKCAPFATAAMWVLRVEAIFEPDLMPHLLECLNGRKIA